MKPFVAIIALVAISFNASAQDPELTQYYNNPLYLNPALAGAKNCQGRAMLHYRNQWPALAGSLVTTTFSADQSFDKIWGGVGLNYLQDVAGEGLLTTSSISLLYSFRLQLDDNSEIRIGFEPQFIQRKMDFSKLRFADQIQANRGFVLPTTEPLVNDPINMFNLNSGVVWQSDRHMVGFALHNVFEPVQSFYGTEESVLPMRFSFHGKTKWLLGSKPNKPHYLEPNALFMLQNKFTQLNATVLYRKGSVLSGVGWRQTFGEFRNADAALFVLGFKVPNFRLVYSYDMTVSDAQSAAPGSHELSMMFTWCMKDEKKKHNDTF